MRIVTLRSDSGHSTGEVVEISHSDDVLTISFYRGGDMEPYASIRTRGNESLAVIARMRELGP